MNDTTMEVRLDNSVTSRLIADAIGHYSMPIQEKHIAYENASHWVLSLPNGAYEVYRNTTTHSVRCAQIGYKGQAGLMRAIAEADRRAEL